jgi:DICT domain-containing protein
MEVGFHAPLVHVKVVEVPVYLQSAERYRSVMDRELRGGVLAARSTDSQHDALRHDFNIGNETVNDCAA